MTKVDWDFLKSQLESIFTCPSTGFGTPIEWTGIARPDRFSVPPHHMRWWCTVALKAIVRQVWDKPDHWAVVRVADGEVRRVLSMPRTVLCTARHLYIQQWLETHYSRPRDLSPISYEQACAGASTLLQTADRKSDIVFTDTMLLGTFRQQPSVEDSELYDLRLALTPAVLEYAGHALRNCLREDYEAYFKGRHVLILTQHQSSTVLGVSHTHKDLSLFDEVSLSMCLFWQRPRGWKNVLCPITMPERLDVVLNHPLPAGPCMGDRIRCIQYFDLRKSTEVMVVQSRRRRAVRRLAPLLQGLDSATDLICGQPTVLPELQSQSRIHRQGAREPLVVNYVYPHQQQVVASISQRSGGIPSGEMLVTGSRVGRTVLSMTEEQRRRVLGLSVDRSPMEARLPAPNPTPDQDLVQDIHQTVARWNHLRDYTILMMDEAPRPRRPRTNNSQS
ncbi:hypothetical protein [Ralstonia phage phiRSL1]|uniref:Uncharacterized protein n=1 Tax=Ralstonia phage phiRSL1 TaxID=1980924 RepID=B2ZXT1_9CAUD|nr:hypothetical protein RSL1_ORF042 [Ralstonia phage phiRSL1]BAG41487.1 hypothetical protein [Ralstonia phage phiRSL1]